MMQITTHSADETQALGQKLASRLAPGDVIAYFGDLGAGKTAFTRGLAQGLGITDPVTSPTYTIVNEPSRSMGKVIQRNRAQSPAAIRDTGSALMASMLMVG